MPLDSAINVAVPDQLCRPTRFVIEHPRRAGAVEC